MRDINWTFTILQQQRREAVEAYRDWWNGLTAATGWLIDSSGWAHCSTGLQFLYSTFVFARSQSCCWVLWLTWNSSGTKLLFCDLPGTVRTQSCYSVTYLEQFGHKVVILWLTWNSSGTKLLFCDLPGTVRAQSCYSVTYLEQFGHKVVILWLTWNSLGTRLLLSSVTNCTPLRMSPCDGNTTTSRQQTTAKARNGGTCVWNKNNSITPNFTYSNI